MRNRPHSANLAALVLILAPTFVVCADQDAHLEPQPVQCPWVPIAKQLPAGAECGFNEAGPNIGLFECGAVSDGVKCVEQCTFKRCMGP
jgi:hypothetical protein